MTFYSYRSVFCVKACTRDSWSVFRHAWLNRACVSDHSSGGADNGQHAGAAQVSNGYSDIRGSAAASAISHLCSDGQPCPQQAPYSASALRTAHEPSVQSMWCSSRGLTLLAGPPFFCGKFCTIALRNSVVLLSPNALHSTAVRHCCIN